jgi:acetyltransferase-like isoleucine patch superfamily enzyme
MKTNTAPSILEENSLLRNPEQISFGNTCIIRKGAILDGKSEVCEYGIALGDNIEICEYAYLNSVLGKIELQSNVFIGPFCLIYGQGGVFIGENTLISGHTTIVASNHSFYGRNLPVKSQVCSMKGIYIGKNVWIGANCCILDGVSIGDNAVIGAGSVVTRSMPQSSIAVGNPCKVIRRLGHKKFVAFESKCRDYAFLKEIDTLKKIIANREQQIRDLNVIQGGDKPQVVYPLGVRIKDFTGSAIGKLKALFLGQPSKRISK